MLDFIENCVLLLFTVAFLTVQIKNACAISQTHSVFVLGSEGNATLLKIENYQIKKHQSACIFMINITQKTFFLLLLFCYFLAAVWWHLYKQQTLYSHKNALVFGPCTYFLFFCFGRTVIGVAPPIFWTNMILRPQWCKNFSMNINMYLLYNDPWCHVVF